MILTRKSSYHKPTKQELQQKLVDDNIKKAWSAYTREADEAKDTKYLQENMLNKLLRPPIKKQNKGQLRKYDPQFAKPDVQKLLHENNQFKIKILDDERTIKELKFKIREQQKKIQKLELNYDENVQQILEKAKTHPSTHTEILNKKIHELHTKCISAESEIKRLKKLPSASLFEQNNIEKQHLLAETIRLKSILTSYQTLNSGQDSNEQQKQPGLSNTINNAKFQQQFLRMLKQENEKLKATIRLLENDKILMKARQTTHNKQSNDLKKQLDNARNKIVLKEAQIQKLAHQNQNLLFKKAAKFRLQKQQKQNNFIQELTKTIEQLRSQKRRLEIEKNQYFHDNEDLKKKQKEKNTLLIDKDKQLQKIKNQVAEIKNEYETRIKSIQISKFYSKDSNFGIKSSKSKNSEIRNFGFEYQNQNNFKQPEAEKTLQKKKFNWGRPIKFQQLDVCLLKLWSLREEGLIENFDDLISPSLLVSSQIEGSRHHKSVSLTFEQLYNIFKSSPINLSAKQSLILSKYIFSDHSSVAEQTSSQPIIEVSLVLTILRASISKFTECLTNVSIINLWKCFLSKSKKFVKELEEINKLIISKEYFVNIVLKNKTAALDFEEVNFMIIHGFCSAQTDEQIMLNRKKMLECMYGLMGDPKYLTSIFLRSNFVQFMPNSEESDNMVNQSMKQSCDSNNKSIFSQNSKLQHRQTTSQNLQLRSNRQINSNMERSYTPCTHSKGVEDMDGEFGKLEIARVETESEQNEVLSVDKNDHMSSKLNKRQSRNHTQLRVLENEEQQYGSQQSQSDSSNLIDRSDLLLDAEFNIADRQIEESNFSQGSSLQQDENTGSRGQLPMNLMRPSESDSEFESSEYYDHMS